MISCTFNFITKFSLGLPNFRNSGRHGRLHTTKSRIQTGKNIANTKNTQISTHSRSRYHAPRLLLDTKRPGFKLGGRVAIRLCRRINLTAIPRKLFRCDVPAVEIANFVDFL